MILEMVLLGTGANYWRKRRRKKQSEKTGSNESSLDIKRLAQDIKSAIQGSDSQQLQAERDSSLQLAADNYPPGYKPGSSRFGINKSVPAWGSKITTSYAKRFNCRQEFL